MCRRLRFLLDFKRVIFRTQLLFVCRPFLSVFLYLSFLMPVCLRHYLTVCMCTRLCAHAYFYLWDRTEVEQDGRTEKEIKGGTFFYKCSKSVLFLLMCQCCRGELYSAAVALQRQLIRNSRWASLTILREYAKRDRMKRDGDEIIRTEKKGIRKKYSG